MARELEFRDQRQLRLQVEEGMARVIGAAEKAGNTRR